MDIPHFPQILDALLSGVVLTEARPPNKIVYVNKAFERLTGYAAAELLGRSPGFLQGDDHDQPGVRELTKAVTAGQEARVIVRNYRKDGSLFWNEIFISPIHNEAGELTHYVGVQNDVTERILSRQELFFAQLSLDNAPEAIMVINEQGKILQANQVACERVEFSLEKLLGYSFYDLTPDYSLASWAAHWQELRQARRLVIETTLETESGRALVAEISFSHFAYGGQEYCCVFARDLTRRKSGQEALRASQARLQAVVENLPFDLWVKDRDNRYILQNKPSMERWGNLLGQTAEDSTLNAALLAIWKDEDERALGGEVVQGETIYTKNGQPHYYQKLIAPVYLDDQVIGTVGVNIEITDRVLAQQALQESEDRLQLALQAADMGIWEWNIRTNVVFWSEQVEPLFGLAPGTFGRTYDAYRALIHPDDLVMVEETIAAALAGITPHYEIIHRVVAPGNQLIWIEARGSVYRNEQGEPLRMIGTVINVSGRKQAELALEESEERLRSLVDNMPILVDAFDEQWQLVFWNKECERVTGYAAAEMIGNPDALAWLYPNPAYRERMMARWHEIGNDFRDWEWEVTCKDGSIKTIAWSNISKYLPIPGYASWGVGVDATQRKQAEQALRRSEERYRAISDLTSDFAYSYRMEPTKIEVQEWITDAFTRITGYEPSVVATARDWRHITHPDERELHDKAQKTLAQGQDGVWEFRVIAKDGRTLWFRFYNRPIIDPVTGQVSQIYGAAQDITLVKQLEEQLLQAQKMEAIGRLAGGIAHDFNNLLTVIVSYGDLLVRRSQQEGVGGNATSRWGQQIKQAAERAAALTQQLLAFSRQQVMEPRVLNLNQIVAQMSEMLRRLIGEDIQMTTLLAPDLGQVRSDANQMEQVILNLVVNARDAMPQGGQLTIETANVILDDQYGRQHLEVIPGPYILLAVTDTGMGIDNNALARIFEPFFTTKEKGKGTGLGLAMVHGIVKQSGGHIWVYSEPGQGTTFKVYLPRVDGVVEPTALVISSELTSSGRETILLVEDEPMLRTLARDLLLLQGYQVLEATGETAEQLCLDYPEPIDLLLTDVVMPVISGRELAEKLAPLRPQMKILYMSGYTDNIIVQHGVLKPGVQFLQKPFTPDGLARKVRAVLDG